MWWDLSRRGFPMHPWRSTFALFKAINNAKYKSHESLIYLEEQVTFGSARTALYFTPRLHSF
jgi:hypothetical protein